MSFPETEFKALEPIRVLMQQEAQVAGWMVGIRDGEQHDSTALEKSVTRTGHEPQKNGSHGPRYASYQMDGGRLRVGSAKLPS